MSVRRAQNYQNINNYNTVQQMGPSSNVMRTNGFTSPTNINSSRVNGQAIKSPTHSQGKINFNSTQRVPNKRVVIRAGSNNPDQDRTSQQMAKAIKPQLQSEPPKLGSMVDSNVVNLLYLEDFDQSFDPAFIS